MNTFAVFLTFALAAVAVAEPPSGYNYNRPSGGHRGGHSGGGGYSSGGSSYVGGFSSGGSFSSGGGYSSGGSLQNVPVGHQTSEGLQVDGQLLNEIRQILLREESQSSSSHGFGGSAPSGSYGAPAPVYGVPHGGHGGRVVGIDLEGVRQAIQVAQYLQTSSSGGLYHGSTPSGSYGVPQVPSGSYGAPSRPSGSYGVPY